MVNTTTHNILKPNKPAKGSIFRKSPPTIPESQNIKQREMFTKENGTNTKLRTKFRQDQEQKKKKK